MTMQWLQQLPFFPQCVPARYRDPGPQHVRRKIRGVQGVLHRTEDLPRFLLLCEPGDAGDGICPPPRRRRCTATPLLSRRPRCTWQAPCGKFREARSGATVAACSPLVARQEEVAHRTPRERDIIHLITQSLSKQPNSGSPERRRHDPTHTHQRTMTKLGLRSSVERAQFAGACSARRGMSPLVHQTCPSTAACAMAEKKQPAEAGWSTKGSSSARCEARSLVEEARPLDVPL